MTDNAYVLVFETGGHVYAYWNLDEAENSLESQDVVEGFYEGAYLTTGEMLVIEPAELSVHLRRTGELDRPGLSKLLADSRLNGTFLSFDQPDDVAARLLQEEGTR